MSAAIAMAGISAGLSILGGIESNKAITKTATAQYGANKLFIERDGAIMQNNLVYQANQVNDEIGMALTKLDMDFDRAAAETTVTQTEREVYGNTAERIQNNVEMQRSLTEDSIIQAGEANMLEVQQAMTSAKYEIENRHIQNLQSFHNQMAQRKSTLSILSEGLSAGMSGYSAGASFDASRASLKASETTLAALRGGK
jgi:hypothetical protein